MDCIGYWCCSSWRARKSRSSVPAHPHLALLAGFPTRLQVVHAVLGIPLGHIVVVIGDGPLVSHGRAGGLLAWRCCPGSASAGAPPRLAREDGACGRIIALARDDAGRGVKLRGSEGLGSPRAIRQQAPPSRSPRSAWASARHAWIAFRHDVGSQDISRATGERVRPAATTTPTTRRATTSVSENPGTVASGERMGWSPRDWEHGGFAPPCTRPGSNGAKERNALRGTGSRCLARLDNHHIQVRRAPGCLRLGASMVDSLPDWVS